MELIIHREELSHLKDISSYNYNYYKYHTSSDDSIILEDCHEDENYSAYYLILNPDDIKDKVFLGCASGYIPEEGSITIDFRLYYT